MKYSPTTRGFYAESVSYANLPTDLVDISDTYHAELLAAQNAGKMISPDADGVPQAVDQPPPDPVAVRLAMSMSFTQLLIGLEEMGWITTAEADGWLDGVLPGPVLALIASLPANRQFAARARAKRPSAVERMNPLVIGLAMATGKTAADLDDFFAAYSAV